MHSGTLQAQVRVESTQYYGSGLRSTNRTLSAHELLSCTDCSEDAYRVDRLMQDLAALPHHGAENILQFHQPISLDVTQDS